MIQLPKFVSGPALIAAGIFMAALSTPVVAQANTESIIYSFLGGRSGANPNFGVLEDRHHNFYGVAGGGVGYGIVFKVTQGREKVLHTFTGRDGDGAGPHCRLILDDAGNLFGTTDGGGDFFFGTVFKLDPKGKETILHSFAGGADGYGPVSSVIPDDAGNLYGTTQAGGTGRGCDNGCGTIFKVTPDGQETVLYSFNGQTDGYQPRARLSRDAQGNFYGTTFLGGPNNTGTVYRLSPDGQFTVLHSFSRGGGNSVTSVILDPAGNLYGTTLDALPFGNVFKLTPDGVYTVLHSFQGGTDGEDPQADLLIDPAGNLYGVLLSPGKVYKVAPDGTETTLYSFTGGADGSTPVGPLYRDAKGNLFGTVYYEGGGSGAIFEVFND